MTYPHTTWGLSLNEQSKLSFTTHSFIPNVELKSLTAHTVRLSQTLTYSNQQELKHTVTHTFTGPSGAWSQEHSFLALRHSHLFLTL